MAERPRSHPSYLNPRRLLTIDEAAQYLYTSVRHMRRLTAEHRLPYFKVGGKLRFLQDDLDRFLRDGRVDGP